MGHFFGDLCGNAKHKIYCFFARYEEHTKRFNHLFSSIYPSLFHSKYFFNFTGVIGQKVTTPLNLPANVLVRGWMPQKRLLAHPLVSCFITHGGLSSLSEAIQVSTFNVVY